MAQVSSELKTCAICMPTLKYLAVSSTYAGASVLWSTLTYHYLVVELCMCVTVGAHADAGVIPWGT